MRNQPNPRCVHTQVEHDLGLPEFESPAAADAHAAQLLRVYRRAAELEAALDEKERGTADALVALAAGALVAAWRLEEAPRQPQRLLRVRACACCYRGACCANR